MIHGGICSKCVHLETCQIAKNYVEYCSSFKNILIGVTNTAKGESTGTYEEKGRQVGALVDKKNKQYGDSFAKSGGILAILYPNGVKPEQYRDMLGVTRVLDKLFRIANGDQGEESAWSDISGYGLLGMKGGTTNEDH